MGMLGMLGMLGICQCPNANPSMGFKGSSATHVCPVVASERSLVPPAWPRRQAAAAGPERPPGAEGRVERAVVRVEVLGRGRGRVGLCLLLLLDAAPRRHDGCRQLLALYVLGVVPARAAVCITHGAGWDAGWLWIHYRQAACVLDGPPAPTLAQRNGTACRTAAPCTGACMPCSGRNCCCDKAHAGMHTNGISMPGLTLGHCHAPRCHRATGKRLRAVRCEACDGALSDSGKRLSTGPGGRRRLQTTMVPASS